jgi:hypothetical protein
VIIRRETQFRKEVLAMKLGISLPLVDIHGDPATVREFAQSAEAMGCQHLGDVSEPAIQPSRLWS